MLLLVLQGLLLVAIVASMAFYSICIYCTLTFERERIGKDGASPSTPMPPLSILIPVRGVDPGALDNWRSFCQQTYSNYEVLFGVMDANDPAIPILKQLREEYPRLVRLLSNLDPRGINYQISNLTYLYEAARYDIIVLADSDIRVGPDYLTTVTAPLQTSGVGAITCPYVEKHPRYLSAAIHALNRCTEFIPSLLVARLLDGGLNCALGPTIVTRKSVMASFGGLNFVLNRIGSDFHIGKMTAQHGYKVELSGYVLDNEGDENLVQVFRRELRWGRTIRINRGAQYYGMVFTFGTVYAWVLAFLSGLAYWAIAVLAVTLGLRFLQAAIAMVHLDRSSLFKWMWLLPIRDATSLVVWIGGAFGRRIYWRGRWLEIGEGGLLSEG